MDIDSLILELQAEGPRRSSLWDADFFGVFCGRALRMMSYALQGAPDREQTLRTAAALMVEATCLGHLNPQTIAYGDSYAVPDCQNFLAHALLALLPSKIAALSPEQRPKCMIDLWNLGEGLLAEPAWINRYVVSQADKIKSLNDLRGFLIDTLKPVLTPAPPATWSGPFMAQRLSTRGSHQDFLPGAIYAASPCVVCVRDRRDDEVELALFLQKGGGSRLLGLTRPMDPWVDELPPPTVAIGAEAITINGKAAALPTLTHPLGHLITESGFVVLSALDSQCLWILESP